jgi:hypothetical protein
MSRFITPLLIFVLFLPLANQVVAQKKQNNNFDGPYIDLVADSIYIKWVEAGTPKRNTIHISEAKTFSVKGLPFVDLTNLSFTPETDYEFEDVKRYAVVSDLHGRYDNLIKLLVAHKVIDSEYQWAFKKRHLVINGDMFGRGDQVMEILWFLFDLEKQAEKEGGKVHILLGNHDVMVLDNDIRYSHQKYLYTQGVLQTRYFELFSDKSVLGRWLRSKNMIIKINDDIITHAGISSEVVSLGLTARELNDHYRTIFSALGEYKPSNKIAEVLHGNEGLLWYRGYKNADQYTPDSIQMMLDHFGGKRIIVGHSIVKNIEAYFDYRVILVDCGLGAGKDGEILLYQSDEYHRGLSDGSKKRVKSLAYLYKPGIFDFLSGQFSEAEQNYPELIIRTDLKRLIKNKNKPDKQEAIVDAILVPGADTLKLNAEMWTRGITRKKVCHLPPVHLDFKKGELARYEIDGSDRLRMVLLCKSGSINQEKLMVEYLVYKMYELIDSQAIRSFPVKVKLLNPKNHIEHEFIGIVIEDRESFVKRRNARFVPETSVVMSEGLHREKFINMYFFQYMIANTDWSVTNKHNLHLIKMPQFDRVIAFPYDYDYAGLVNNSYAVPHNSLPIKDVRTRYFMSMRITEKEFESGIEFYKSKKGDLLDLVESAPYLTKSQKDDIVYFLSGFFDELSNPRILKSKATFEFWKGNN